MRRLLPLAMVLTLSAKAWAQTPAEAFAGLAGSCWTADIGEGGTDTHCFTVATGGKLVLDVHKVRNRLGEVVYEGVTTYRVEKESGAIGYEYYNSLGDRLPGYGRREGDRLLFSPAPQGAPDVVWYLEADAYEVGSPAEAAARTRFVRARPAGEGGL